MEEIKGKLVGVKLTPRDEDDEHILLQLMLEDDESWFDTDFVISSYWIDDLIETLQKTKEHLLTKVPDSQYGWRFK